MNLQQMLEEALANVEAMTADEFEAECIKAGYTPERKVSFNLSQSVTIDDIDASDFSYMSSISLTINDIDDVDYEAANDSSFQLAA